MNVIRSGEKLDKTEKNEPTAIENTKIFFLPLVSARYPHMCDVKIIPDEEKRHFFYFLSQRLQQKKLHCLPMNGIAASHPFWVNVRFRSHWQAGMT